VAGAVTTLPVRTAAARSATAESPVIKTLLVGILLAFFGLFLVLPLVVVFHEAFAKGVQVFLRSFQDRATAHAVQLTLLTAAIVVPLNAIFGLFAAWAVTRFTFRGRSLLISLIDLPLWVSPVIGGLIYVLIFGRQGWLGPLFFPSEETLASNFLARFIYDHNIKIIFAEPGIILATIFVTFPFVARGLIPLMQAQGHKEEEAAMTLGANGWQTFSRVTLPKIKWGLIYGLILCNARAMGEFGAVSVVSGHIRNKTNTMPLHIEILYNEYQFAAAFAVASVLSVFALLTLLIKAYVEWNTERQVREAAATGG
jgi:sulfate/thiosulfate transport system permease protein